MEPFRYHVFVCDQQKPEGAPSCAARGSGKVIDALTREVVAQRLMDAVQITTCGSLDLCESGPNMVVYPEGVWYCGVRPEDAREIVRSHFGEGTIVERLARIDTSELRAEILANRQRRQAALRAKDAAGALPDGLLQTTRAFQESRVILSAIELDAFSAVGAGAAAAEVASKLATNPRATEMFLNALVAMGLLSKKEGVYYNTPVTERYFVAGSRDDARAAMMHAVHLWPRWSTLTDAVRTGTAVSHEEMGDRCDDWTIAFIAAMDRGAAERAPLVVRAVGTVGANRMLDVGGGSGAYSIAFAKANPMLHAEVLDLPTVIPITQSHVRKADLEDRVTVRAGDLRADTFGEGYDLVFVSSICHMLDPEENLALLGKCHAALVPGGRVVIQDFILEADKTAPRSAALFALNMLVGTRGGSSYSEEEYVGWLQAKGFQDVRRIRLPGPSDLMLGTKH